MTSKQALGTAITAIAIGAVVTTGYLYSTGIITSPDVFSPFLSLGELASIPKTISTPAPLRHDADIQGALTADGVFTKTNEQRQQNSLPSLLRNDTLDEAARLKLNDMFAQQYFEHISPDGRGPADVVETVEYEYITVGENLALGNFGSDEALVQAWMDSPGHRANILSDNFQALGIAVGQGEFEGRTTWLAVQTFGTPLSACPSPDTSVLKNFENKEFAAKDLEGTLVDLNQQIAEQTIIVEDLVQEADSLVTQGNAKIAAGNANIKKGNEVYRDTGSQEQAQPYWDEGQQQQAEGATLLDQAQAKQIEAEQENEKLTVLSQQYNDLLKQYSQSSSSTQVAAEKYNEQVRIFNGCVQQFE